MTGAGWVAVEAGLKMIAAVAPGFLAQWTDEASDEDAIASARSLVDGLPVAEHGDDGEWDEDLEARVAGGTRDEAAEA